MGEIRIGLTVGWHPYSVSVSVFVLENVMFCVGRDLVLRIRICIRVTAIRNTDTDTEYGTVTKTRIRNTDTDTEYGTLPNGRPTPSVQCRIRMWMQNAEPCPTLAPHHGNTDADTDAECGVLPNTCPRSNTDADTDAKCGVLPTTYTVPVTIRMRMRMQNTDPAPRGRSVNTEWGQKIRSSQYGA